MSIINITVEGLSEQKFCNDLLSQYLYVHAGHNVLASRVTTNSRKNARGGSVNWAKLNHHLDSWMKSTPGQHHTTMFDLYALDTTMPGYNTSLTGVNKAHAIEAAMSTAINSRYFIPYIQVHEFEALLFSAPETMNKWLSPGTQSDLQFEQVMAGYSTPEDINEGVETAPSKRIIAMHNKYEKVDDGFIIASEIGIDRMRQCCPHFNAWVAQLLAL